MSIATDYSELEQRLRRESRARVIMFADMVGSTDIKKERFFYAMAVISEHNRIATAVMTELFEERAASTGSSVADVGQIVKYIGDEVMVAISVDHADLAYSGAKLIVERLARDREENGGRIHSKIGIALGDTVSIPHGPVEVFDPHGVAVDRAARLVAIAQPDQILVDQPFRDAIDGMEVRPPHYFPSDRGQLTYLKGFEKPAAVSAVVAAQGDDAEILNLAKLRSECKIVEEALTNLLLMLKRKAPLIERELGAAADTDAKSSRRKEAYAEAKTHVEELVLREYGAIYKVREIYRQKAKELQTTPSIDGKTPTVNQLFGELSDSYDRLRDGVKGRRSELLAREPRSAEIGYTKCLEDLEKFRDTADDLHVLVDKWIRLADGTAERVEVS